VGKDRAGSEDKVLQEIELGHNANQMVIFHHGESIEIISLKQMLKFPQAELPRDRQGELGHDILGLHAKKREEPRLSLGALALSGSGE
jgi:hypothetical protein